MAEKALTSDAKSVKVIKLIEDTNKLYNQYYKALKLRKSLESNDISRSLFSTFVGLLAACLMIYKAITVNLDTGLALGALSYLIYSVIGILSITLIDIYLVVRTKTWQHKAQDLIILRRELCLNPETDIFSTLDIIASGKLPKQTK